MEPIYGDSWLPIIFAGLMGLAILIYVILDGYDLGVGILMSGKSESHKDQMISSIAPFWDANETWLVLAVGLLLVAFPVAHGEILTSLYIPVTIMLVGLILRGVSFDFRSKAKTDHKLWWDRAFITGSILTSYMQGYMLGLYIMGFEKSYSATFFALLVGFCMIAGYAFMGSCWLIMKTSGKLQLKSIRSARRSLWLTFISVALISIATPIVNEEIFARWFHLPNIIVLVQVPLIISVLAIGINYVLRKLPKKKSWTGLPFMGAVLIFVLCFQGLAYSFYPYVIPGKLTIWQAASSEEALVIILIGALLVIPMIIAYTIFSYKVFWGKAKELHYY